MQHPERWSGRYAARLSVPEILYIIKDYLDDALVNEPVAVRNAAGRMVHNLEAKDFRITDNGVGQSIIYFEVGGDAISLVVLVETSSRIDLILPDLRKSGSVVSQVVMGQTPRQRS